MNSPLLLRGGRLLDPATGEDRVDDLFIQDGRIAEIPPALPPDTTLLEVEGYVVTPGFVDLHVHLREPGGEEAETIQSGLRAAVRGGFTTVVSMPNTRPPIATPELVAFVIEKARATGLARVLPSACITKDREGFEVADLEALAAAGAAIFTDDGTTVATVQVLQEAMQRIQRLGMVLMDHAHDRELEKKGVMHEGVFSQRHGLPGIPSRAETLIVQRDIEMAAQTGCALHIQHVSAGESVRLLREAQRQGLRVSGELTPHHLALTDAEVDPADANYKMNPPLRSAQDREQLLEGICDGTLCALATDHAPHTAAAKARGFLAAPFGILGLETAIGITYTALVASGRMDLLAWVRRWTTGPAAILNQPAPSLRPGAPADLAVLDLKTPWTVDPADSASLSRNTPFAGRRLTGRARHAVYKGRLVYSAESHLLPL